MAVPNEKTREAILNFSYAVDVCGLEPLIATGAVVPTSYPSDLAKPSPIPAVYYVVERDQEPKSVTVLRRTGSEAIKTLAQANIDQKTACVAFFVANDGTSQAVRINNGAVHLDVIHATKLRTEILGDVWKITVV